MQVTEGLTLTKCRKANGLLLDIMMVVSLQNLFLIEELRSVLSLLYSWEMTPECQMSSPFGSLHFSFLTFWENHIAMGFCGKSGGFSKMTSEELYCVKIL